MMRTAEQSKILSLTALIQRVIVALAFACLAAGETLHINAFVQNGIDIGLPYSRVLCTAAVIITFISAIGILLGLFFRTLSAAAAVITLFSGFFFFAGSFNKVNVVGTLFALALLAGFIMCGPGKYSLDYRLRKKKERENKRILFR